MWAVWLSPFPTGLIVWFTSGTSEVSRFSCVKFPDVRGVSDYAELAQSSRYRSWPCCLPL